MEHAMTKARTPQMSLDELLGLPVVVDLPTAGRAFRIGATRSYEMARADEFPCRVLHRGRFLQVLKADLMRELGLTVDGKPLPGAEMPAAGAA
jgi:hypothetical protein